MPNEDISAPTWTDQTTTGSGRDEAILPRAKPTRTTGVYIDLNIHGTYKTAHGDLTTVDYMVNRSTSPGHIDTNTGQMGTGDMLASIYN